MRPLLSVVLVPSAPMNEEMTLDGGVGQQDFGQFLLQLRHRAETTSSADACEMP